LLLLLLLCIVVLLLPCVKPGDAASFSAMPVSHTTLLQLCDLALHDQV
jgi:hypothetical protein